MFEKEAEDSFKCKKVLFKWETDKHSYINGFKDGATFGYNKAKEEMQEQIEKMKCCGNCKYFNFSEPNYCHKGVYRERQYVCDKWEFGN